MTSQKRRGLPVLDFHHPDVGIHAGLGGKARCHRLAIGTVQEAFEKALTGVIIVKGALWGGTEKIDGAVEPVEHDVDRPGFRRAFRHDGREGVLAETATHERSHPEFRCKTHCRPFPCPDVAGARHGMTCVTGAGRA